MRIELKYFRVALFVVLISTWFEHCSTHESSIRLRGGWASILLPDVLSQPLPGTALFPDLSAMHLMLRSTSQERRSLQKEISMKSRWDSSVREDKKCSESIEVCKFYAPVSG
eukprot:746820-Hanusia_phi.AAC.3